MKTKGILSGILRQKQTVFSFKDFVLLWTGIDKFTAASRINYYVRKGELLQLRRGLYAKDENYDRLELATKILTPSYVSLETVLAREGIIFQLYSRIFLVSYQTKEIVCAGQAYSFKKIKDVILTNNTGIENRDRDSIASGERAFLDVLYLNKDYHFDNLSPLNWDRVLALLPIYGNKRMQKKVNEYIKHIGNEKNKL